MRFSSLLDKWFGNSSNVPGQGLETAFEHSWPVPIGITLLGILIVLGVVLTVYHFEQRGGRPIRALLAALRIGVFGLALFMLYGWVRHQHQTELPQLVIAVDVSESMAFDDAYESPRFRRAVERIVGPNVSDATRVKLAGALLNDQRRGWIGRLSAAYRIKLFRLGDGTRRVGAEESATELWKATDAASRLGDGLLEILKGQRGLSTAAVILLTDGANTGGASVSRAAEYARANRIPLHIVGIGSERPPADVRISDLLVEEAVFTGDLLDFNFQLHSHGFAGRGATVRVTRGDSGEVVAEQEVTLPKDGESLPVSIAYRPTEEGIFEHMVEVLPLDTEADHDNNRLPRRIAVRNATIRVLLVQAAPSNEYRFLKNLLSRATGHADGSGRAIELTTVLQESDIQQTQQDATAARLFPVRREDLFAYDVLILGDADPGYFTESSLQNISDFVTERGGGLLMFPGPRFMPRAYADTALATLFPFDAATTQLPTEDSLDTAGRSLRLTALGKEVAFLQLADVKGEHEKTWSRLPPARWFIDTPDLKPAAVVLAEHPTRRLLNGTALPMITLQFVGAGKVLFHSTDETYLWSRLDGSDEYYARYWTQAIRYLGHFKLETADVSVAVATNSQQYLDGDVVHVRVTFRDDRLAPVETGGVTVTVEHQDGKRHVIPLVRGQASRGEFDGQLTNLPVGSYKLWLTTPTLDRSPPLHEFSVNSRDREMSVLQMNSKELAAAARLTRGQFYTLETAARLPSRLPRGKQVRIGALPADPIWNSPWIAGLFVILLTTEWTLRKRVGLL